MTHAGFDFAHHPPIERKPDGSLIRLSLKQWWAVKRLTREQCCHFDPDGNCLLLDNGEPVACPQLWSRSLCCTFLRFVLMKAAAAADLEMSIFYGNEIRYCARCGRPFLPGGNRAKYCSQCKVIARREQKAASSKRLRAGVEK